MAPRRHPEPSRSRSSWWRWSSSIVVIVATSKMFGTASRVTGVGQAGAAVLQEAAAVERQFRSDFERLSREGFFVIRCVAVPNDVNVSSGGRAAQRVPAARCDHPRRPVALLRARRADDPDARGGRGGQPQGAGEREPHLLRARVPAARRPMPSGFPADGVEAQDPRVQTGDPLLVPWYRGPHDMVRTVFQDDPSGADYDTTTDDGSIDATQPPANRWLLARHAVVLVGDGGYSASHLEGVPGGNTRTANWIDHAVVLGGRVDAAESELNDIRADVLDADDNGFVDYSWHAAAQRDRRLSLLPAGGAGRAGDAPRGSGPDQQRHERRVQLVHHRLDVRARRGGGSRCRGHEVAGVLGSGGLSVRQIRGSPGSASTQRVIPPSAGACGPTTSTGTTWTPATERPETILPDNIEPAGVPADTRRGRHRSHGRDRVRGCLRLQPGSAPRPHRQPVGNRPRQRIQVAYTPWPSAIRITMVLHDPETKLEAGRQIQFVIDLPSRDR